MFPSYDNDESVFDLSLIKEEERRLRQGLQDSNCCGSTCAVVSDTKTPLEQQCKSWEDSLPPLDSVTADTTVPEDDSSVSTFGSVTSSSRRFVFSKYWAATGQIPAMIRKRPDACSPRLSTGKKTHQHPSHQRRSIIMSGSYNSLPGVIEAQEFTMERKSVSVGDLCAEGSSSGHKSSRAGGRLQSCLRRDPLYSGDNSYRKQQTSFSSASSCSIHEEEDDLAADDSSSVRFDLDATAVRHFARPDEVHAEQGWSNYFH